MPSRRLALLLLAASSLSAQVPPGFAVVAWKPPSGGAGGLKLVDRAGGSADVLGLDPMTIGTSTWDGARAVLVDGAGEVFVGLGVDNRAGPAPRPLDLRRVRLLGSTATSDQRFTTLMQVAAGEVWHVSDLESWPDGSLLVGVTEVVFGANPMPRTQALRVDLAGAVTALPMAGAPAGGLRAVAAAGDRWLGAFEQSFFVVNVEVVSFPATTAAAPPFQVHQFVNVASFGGLDVDADGTLLVGIAAGSAPGGSALRLPHAASATPAVVPGSPGGVEACDAMPAAGLFAMFALPRNPLAPLVLVDTLAATTTPWSPGVALDPVDLALRRNPASYGPASPAGARAPYLGTYGGLPTAGNGGFGLRIGGTPLSAGALLAGVARGSVPTPFGLLLLDPGQLLVTLAPFALPASGAVNVPAPLPAGVRGRVLLQAALFPSLVPPVGETTNGVEITFL